MSLKDCIRNAQQAGHITLEEAQALTKRYDAIVRSVFSEGKARDQLIAELEAEKLEKKRRALLTETARKRVEQALFSHRDEKGRPDIAEAFKLLHEHHGEGRMTDIETKRLAILGQAHAAMDGVLKEFRKGAVTGDLRRRFGSTRARLDNVVRELFGEGTGDEPAKALARAWSEVSEDLRQRFNAAGGAVARLETWGLPQHHDAEALLNVGRDRWVETITPLLDAKKMLHPLTRQPMNETDLRDSLRLIWERITTEGWIDREPTGAPVGRGALLRQHADHRFLHFKSADDWLKYQRDFGEGDPFAAMMGHLSTMTRDIAAMEVLGPNPEAMRNYLKQVVTAQAAKMRPLERIAADLQAALKRMAGQQSPFAAAFEKAALTLDAINREAEALRAKGTRRAKRKLGPLERQLADAMADLDAISAGWDDAVSRLAGETKRALANKVIFADAANPLDHARQVLFHADAMWDVMRGSANVPVNSKIANTLQSARNLVSAAALGSAQISAISDIAFGKITRQFVGLEKAGALRVISDTVRMLLPANRMEAVRAGLMLDSAIHVMHQQARYVGSIHATSVTGFLADRVIGLQGLSAWTQAGKHAFGLAMQAEFADRVGLALDALPEALRNTLERHGITAGDWDRIRTTALYQPQQGVTFLRPNEIAQFAGRDLAEKYQMMILRETRFAVPEGTVRSQSTLRAGRPGTFVGEITRNFAQFKSFGVAVVLLHGGRIAREIGAGRGAKGAFYAGSLLITGTLLGALALQLKALKDGQDPRDMKSTGFWGAALLQAGGMGIYGDFLFAGVNRFGGGLTSTVAGPLVGKFDKLRDFGIGNPMQVGEGGPTNAGREAVGLLRDWTPGGSLWYARLAYERIVLDQLQQLLDPQARAASRRKMTQRRNTYGNDFWWRPGATAPRRAPDFGAALGK